MTKSCKPPPYRRDWKHRVLAEIVPAQTALALVDLQNDFCSPSGALALRGSDVGPSTQVAERIAARLGELRSIADTVAFFRLVYDVELMSQAQRERLLINGAPVICATEGEGTSLYKVQPSPGDHVFIKHRYSAFTVDDFVNLLRSRDVDTVVVAGVDTHICVEGTVRHGYDLGFRMVILSDMVATRASERERHAHSLALCEKYFGTVLTTNEMLGAQGARH